MNKSKTKIYATGGIIALALAVAIGIWYRAESPKLPVNQSPDLFKLIDKMEKEGVPDFELKRLDGSTLKLSSLRGKLVVVNFWASWCNPCVQEFPSMVKLGEHFKGDLVIVAVATDDEKGDVEAFTKAFGVPKPGFDVVWDEKKTVMTEYGVEKIPESFIIDKNGKLLRKILGIEEWATPNAFAFFDHLLTPEKK